MKFRAVFFAAASFATTAALILPMRIFGASGAINEAPRVPIEHPNVLPLALDDHFQFRKTEHFLNEPTTFKPTLDPMLLFERQRINYKAVTGNEELQKRGDYYTFFWRATLTAPITVRFEYRQEKLGTFVLAREVFYPQARGSIITKFEVTGDDYLDDGRVIAWRALLIADGKIVGLTQSFLWE